VEDHVNALEKAAKKARERLEELRAKPLEKDQKAEEESYSYYSYSPSPQPTGAKRKLSKKSTKSSSASSSSSLEKDAGKTSLEKGVDKTSLEKDVRKEEVRRTRVAKSGQAESLKEIKDADAPEQEDDG